MLEPTTSMSTPSADSLLMYQLASDTVPDNANIDGDKLLNRAKLFLVAQACNELNRVIKMTNLLDKLEEKFTSLIYEKLDENPNNLQLLTMAMETITNSLERSNDIITQVLKDEKLSAIIINTTNIITPDGTSATIMDVNSRDTIRNMASSLLSQLQHLSDTSENQSESLITSDNNDNITIPTNTINADTIKSETSTEG